MKGNCKFCNSSNIKKSSTYPDCYFCESCKNGDEIKNLKSQVELSSTLDEKDKHSQNDAAGGKTIWVKTNHVPGSCDDLVEVPVIYGKSG